MHKILIFIFISIILFIFILSSCSSIKKTFDKEVEKEINKFSYNDFEFFTEEEISYLPEPVQKYFRYCGYLGKIKMINAKVEWEEFNLKLSPDKNWMDTKVVQLNSIPEPARIVYMKTHLFKFIKFEGRDKFQNGYGSMKGKLANIINIFDEENSYMDQSALVTVLSEALFIPNYALQDYITWEEIDENKSKATIKYNNIKASGIFYFDNDGKFYKFYTEDRYYNEGDNNKLVPWVIYVDNYQTINDIKIANEVRASWLLENQEYEYFKGKISNVIFNVEK